MDDVKQVGAESGKDEGRDTRGLLSGIASAAASPGEAVRKLLRSIRLHLGMQVAFVAEFDQGRRYFRYTDSDDAASPVKEGGSDPLEESYCARVVDGRLPSLMRDASTVPEARALPVTAALPVGAHLSVPITLSDGRVFGTFCCFSSAVDNTLSARDVETMRVFAGVAADYVERDLGEQIRRAEVAARVSDVITSGALSSVYQPIYQLSDHAISGFEALTRFNTSPAQTPDLWFGEAASADMSEVLETAAIRCALRALPHLPSSIYVSVNASPQFITCGGLAAVLDDQPLERILLEVTEHAAIDSYEDMAAALTPLRLRGMHVAVDDAGAGYASFRHILQLEPDVIKLDVSITRGLNTDPARRSLAAALIGFAQATGTRVIAEGVETAEELEALRELGVSSAQGYYLGKPMALAEGLARLEAEVPRAMPPTPNEAGAGSWHVVVLTDKQIARFDALRLQSYFEAVWMREASPRAAAIYSQTRLSRRQHPFYLAPAAAGFFVPFLHAHTAFRASPCAPPSRGAISFLAGDPALSEGSDHA